MKANRLFILMLFVVGMSLQLLAQTGEIIYIQNDESRMRNMDDDRMPEEMKKQFAGLMAQMSKSTKKLMFNTTSSNFIDITGEQSKEINETSVDGGEMQMQIKRDPNLEEYYTDLTTGKYVHKRSIFGKYFLVNETIESPKWKMIQEQKEILGYECMKATAEDEEGNEVTAWYTMAIPLAIGPDTWGGLPGTILELQQGGISYEATEVDLKAKPIIKVPKDGKKIGLKKFLKLEERKTKERQKLYGGDGRMMIIREEESN